MFRPDQQCEVGGRSRARIWKCWSRAIVGIGSVALIALLHRFAKGSEKGGGAPKAGPKPGPTEAEKIAALRSAKPVEQVKPVKPVEKAKPAENA